MKILISACVLGHAVRWNGANKLNRDISEWAEKHGFELVPVCPEDALFGTPRKTIRLIQVGDEVKGMMGGSDVYPQLVDEAKQTLRRHRDAVGFIGIARSPTCGQAAGVKNRGSTMKGPMHEHARFPTVEINSMRTPKNRMHFLDRIVKYITYNSHATKKKITGGTTYDT